MRKDVMAALGIFGALVIVVIANVMEGGSPTSLLLFPPMLLVLGCTILVSLAGGTVADAKRVPASLRKAFNGSTPDPRGSIPQLVQLAGTARRDGMLALEPKLDDIGDPFMRQGVQMLIDSTDADDMRDIFEAKINAKRADVRSEAKFFAEAGAYAPTIGIIGTVMGLVHVLESLNDPEELGHLIAAAFVATLWGVLSANIVFLPLASRLRRMGEIEVESMVVVMEGVMSIQAGTQTRAMDDKLRSLLPEGTSEARAA